jgi:hypothetical protein
MRSPFLSGEEIARESPPKPVAVAIEWIGADFRHRAREPSGQAVHMGCYVELEHATARLRDSSPPTPPRRSAAENDEGPALCAGPSTFVSDDQVVGRTFAACGPF